MPEPVIVYTPSPTETLPSIPTCPISLLSHAAGKLAALTVKLVVALVTLPATLVTTTA